MALILITPFIKCSANGAYYHLNRDYAEAIARAGAQPAVGPFVKDAVEAERWAALADGLLLSGGEDVSPEMYGEENLYCGAVSAERDLSEKLLLEAFMRLKKPVLGICRGVQLMNAALGGTLYQDIALQVPHTLTHPRSDLPADCVHKNRIGKDSLLYSIFGCREISVNSRHHQAVKNPAPGMRICCRSEDGVTEGIEKDTAEYPFLLGIQWHPESMAERYPEMQRVFDTFVSAAERNRK